MIAAIRDEIAVKSRKLPFVTPQKATFATKKTVRNGEKATCRSARISSMA